MRLTPRPLWRRCSLVVVALTAIGCSATGSPRAAAADIWATVSPIVDPTALPLGDKRYVVDGPRRGYVFTCDLKMFEFKNIVGATKTGPWIHGSTFDITAKPRVGGSVRHDGSFTVSAQGGARVFAGNGLPTGVPTGIFPTRPSDPAYAYDMNPNAIEQQRVSFSVPLEPVVAARPTCTGLEVGITLDGVELSGPLDSSGRDELAYEMMDDCSGMSQPGGLYHRHALSNCLAQVHDKAGLVGYALDGFGIYGPYDAGGRELTTRDLDECHGTTSPIVWEGKLVTMYHYVLTRDFPYSVSCFRGTPVGASFPALPPPPAPDPGGPLAPTPDSGPPSCNTASDCTSACPAAAKGCTCAPTPDGSRCLPTCSTSADCPPVPDGTLTCSASHVCLL
jgi:hypothetical protein